MSESRRRDEHRDVSPGLGWDLGPDERLGQRLRSLAETLDVPVPPFAVPDGLEIVRYCTVDSPVGPLLLAGTSRGIVRLAFLRDGEDDTAAGVSAPDAVLQSLADRITPRVVEAGSALDGARRELDAFFSGARRAFELPLDWRLSSGFTRAVLRATATIPYGTTASYGAIASQAGSPRASRAAGSALGANPIPIIVPCHRVLRSGGALGGYAGGPERKLTLLRIEGIARGQ